MGFLLTVPSLSSFSQVAVNADGAQPNASAGLDVDFNNKGLLPPRLSHAQIDAITTPANGLLVYCTNCSIAGKGALMMYNDGWQTFEATCLAPPVTGIHHQDLTQITWNWNPVQGANGYKWNTSNNFAGAIDVGTAIFKTEVDLSCNTPYTRYIWAYSWCGASSVTSIAQKTDACK